MSTKKRYDAADFNVVKGSRPSGCLLGSSSAANLGILHIVNCVKFKQCKFTGEVSTCLIQKRG